MSEYRSLAEKLANKEVVILDGAVGTQLQSLHVPMNSRAGAAEAPVSHPYTVRRMHEDYIAAGGDVITVNSYASARHKWSAPFDRAAGNTLALTLVVAASCLAAVIGQAAAQEQSREIHGWALREALAPDQEYLLRNPAYDILIVRVLDVDDRGATNADPPAVTLEIEEVLRGPSRRGRVAARWQGPIWHEDLPPEGGTTEAWQNRPLSGPAVGDRLIVFGGGPEDAFTVQAHAVYRLTAANRQAVLEHASRTHSVNAFIVLWVGMGACTLGALTVFIFSFFAQDRTGRAERLRLGVIAFAAAALGLYVYYESGVSPYAAIRIDLLLLWPAVGITLILGAISLVLILKAKRGR